MKNEIFKKMRTMILLLGVTLFFSSFVSSDDDYIIINCPGNLAYDPVVDACVPEAENDGKGLVCVIKKIKTGEIKFACDPKEKRIIVEQILGDMNYHVLMQQLLSLIKVLICREY